MHSKWVNCMAHDFSSVHLLICVQLFATAWTAARQAFLSITNSQSFPNSCPLSRWCHPTIKLYLQRREKRGKQSHALQFCLKQLREKRSKYVRLNIVKPGCWIHEGLFHYSLYLCVFLKLKKKNKTKLEDGSSLWTSMPLNFHLKRHSLAFITAK